ncbi:MAG TPA: hypothetical protein VJ976_08115 [Ornithinimicrobium sp.]|uniref:hypothetical protein n=1 Tax=Ornithinimicrobium sp. TaxID=1977084 RepID=UPI002B47D377|nr:hypothetical protein [Ornithinimicrobium sp.]HKJ12337.1 hypothetical protein [Ornithinimicrobium sp.]
MSTTVTVKVEAPVDGAETDQAPAPTHLPDAEEMQGSRGISTAESDAGSAGPAPDMDVAHLESAGTDADADASSGPAPSLDPS